MNDDSSSHSEHTENKATIAEMARMLSDLESKMGPWHPASSRKRRTSAMALSRCWKRFRLPPSPDASTPIDNEQKFSFFLFAIATHHGELVVHLLAARR